MQSLRKERPRAGRRKPIEKDEEEEDAKLDEGPGASNEEKADGDRPKEHKESLVIRNTSVPQVNHILSSYSVSLTAAKNGMMGSRKAEDGQEE